MNYETTKRPLDETDEDGSSSDKRRKSRKGLHKQFTCDEPGCGKSFTRLEHLCRHQLNRKLVLIMVKLLHVKQKN